MTFIHIDTQTAVHSIGEHFIAQSDASESVTTPIAYNYGDTVVTLNYAKCGAGEYSCWHIIAKATRFGRTVSNVLPPIQLSWDITAAVECLVHSLEVGE